MINAIPNNRNLQFENITAINNSAKYNGGALSLNASGANEIHVEISGRIENNTAENNGGGIYLNKIKTTTLADVIITGNTANKTFQGVGGGPVSGAGLRSRSELERRHADLQELYAARYNGQQSGRRCRRFL